MLYENEIKASHPMRHCTPEAYAWDALAMTLVGERYEKRDLVNLVRWLIMEGAQQIRDNSLESSNCSKYQHHSGSDGDEIVFQKKWEPEPGEIVNVEVPGVELFPMEFIFMTSDGRYLLWTKDKTRAIAVDKEYCYQIT